MEKSVLQNNRITLADAPHIPGLSFRSFRGESDYPKMVAVIKGSKDADQIERVDEVEDVARNYKHLINSNPYKDMLFAEIDREVIGYQRVLWREELDGTRIYQLFGFLLPEWRRKGIGRAMFHWAERRLVEIAATHPKGQPKELESECADTEIGREALIKSEGYRAVRHSYIMVRPDLENIPDLALPEGVEIRPVLPEHYQKINDASKEAFQDDWGFCPDFEDTVEQWLEDPNFDPTLWRVAWEGDEVAGMVLNYIDTRANEAYGYKRGWTENICVRRPWRKKGIARALIADSLRAIKERGMLQAALGVDTENVSGALRLYEGMGYQPIKRFSIYRKPLVI